MCVSVKVDDDQSEKSGAQNAQKYKKNPCLVFLCFISPGYTA